jgi:integrase
MSWAKLEGYAQTNPLADLKKLPEMQWEGSRPAEAIIDAVFSKLDAVVLPLFTFIRETGCRREEALSLRHGQLDMTNREVLFVGNTKSGKARRVPLTEKAMEAIRAMPRSPHCTYVFYRPDGLKRWHDCRRPWVNARIEAEFPWLLVKDLRRAYAIKLAERGCPMHYIQAMLGHYPVSLTEKYYAQFSPDSAGRAVLMVLEGGKGKTGVDGNKTGTQD